ncbi:MAG TPA: ABC transporter ATP-binding protein [Dissulfurispiraceae bacterium]
MHAIEISHLSKTFKGKGGARIEALKDLSLDTEPGEVFGFLGPNGAGKSTTIKLLMGLISPAAGSARLMGDDSRSHRARRHVGYLPENPSFYDYLSAWEYLLFVGKVFGMRGALLTERAESILRLVDLWDARNRSMRGYSKGMVQRLGIAQTLLHDPDVYILDEPMSGLDPVGRALVKEIILDLKSKGKCVFFSTHITSDVETVCDRVGIILHGVLRSVERVETILHEGIIGYAVQARDAATGRNEELYTEKGELSGLMSKLAAEGREIVFVEPKRKSLEDFFLDIVKGKNAP